MTERAVLALVRAGVDAREPFVDEVLYEVYWRVLFGQRLEHQLGAQVRAIDQSTTRRFHASTAPVPD